MQSLCLKDPQSCPSACVCVWGGGVCSELRYGGPGGSGAGGGGILELVTT